MESVFRSADMTLCQLYMPSESAYEITSQLGELGIVEFVDLNSDTTSFNKYFVNEIKRCNELERQLAFFEKEIRKENISYIESTDYPAPLPRELIDFEATFSKIETELNEINTNLTALNRDCAKLFELKTVLVNADKMFDNSDYRGFDRTPILPEMELSDFSHHVQSQLVIITGTLTREKISTFSRLLWYMSRGNMFIRYTDLVYENEQYDEPKSLFTLFLQGPRLEKLAKKVCEGFKADLYPCPETLEERLEMMSSVESRLSEMDIVITKSKEQRHRVLIAIGENLCSWKIKLRKVKSIFFHMNMFKIERNYIAHCWVPSALIATVQGVLEKAGQNVGSSTPSILHKLPTVNPPTHVQTNKFTAAYQKVIDAYGVGTYKEINPMPYTLITFPFLFAVMFGDAGHGLIMFLFAFIVVFFEKRLMEVGKNQEIWQIFFSGRYMILMMGLFSIYTGFLYNDYFSKSINIFGSSWRVIYDNKTIFDKNGPSIRMLDPNSTSFLGEAYPVGIDPVWQMSKNKISFSNSLKKKMSVVLGVIHMLFGVVLSFFNYKHKKRYLDIFCVFIPEIIFMVSMFGYLVMIIFVKWVKFGPTDPNCAPSLLIGLINMFMMKYPKVGDHTVDCSLWSWYKGQQALQTLLVVLIVICIPWMLLTKPFILYYRNRANTNVNNNQIVRKPSKREDKNRLIDDVENPAEVDVQILDSHSLSSDVPLEEFEQQDIPKEEFEMGDVLIRQAIHTIEYCLGCVSNTASYLRLWALSLAHAQLSEVLWSMVLKIGFSWSSYAAVFILVPIFAAWAMLTLGILILMEGLSAFLHALRLHWIEFQTKFYKGEGWKFEPFSFKQTNREGY
ncbi:unnamed protein product [Dimorphilus gyrociliatus]|uniref:V-type proton ATPase subunit a n=1 Tax=Dimorphilus gyrociliatus TaxID=2664684 RepID=A0A7I8VIT8_9ANNE|nr:unnamed protein product [Dimorphilus gyrociliatus]